jgi:hypothetical protein
VDVRATAGDVNWRILEDGGGPPHFARMSQNIATTAALLQGLQELPTPEGRRALHKLRTLLERATEE